MATYQDLIPSETGWIHDLAKGEIHPEADKILELGKAFDPQQLVEESTMQFLTELREGFARFAKLFNGYSEGGSRFSEVKIYSVAQTAADFMVFRNQVKLVVGNAAHGVIRITFARHVPNTVGFPGNANDRKEGQPSDLLAQVGPFRNVYWIFDGQRIAPDEVTKFYFAEFIRATREQGRSRAGSELLLKQIKSLLEEKGLEL